MAEFSVPLEPIDVTKMTLIDPSTYVLPLGCQESSQNDDTSQRLKINRIRRKRNRRAEQASLEPTNRLVKAFFKAVSSANIASAKRLLAQDVDVCSSDHHGRTALHIAAAAGNNDMVRVLLDHGASANKQDCIGNTPLHLAACINSIPTVTMLLAAGTDMSLVDRRGNTPLTLAYNKVKLLRNELSVFSTEENTRQVEQIVYMLREYMNRLGNTEAMSELFDIAGKLSSTKTTDGVTEICDLLESFTSLSLEKQEQEQATGVSPSLSTGHGDGLLLAS